MTTIYDIRRTNAIDIAKRIGGQSKFAERAGMSTQQVSHIIGVSMVKRIGDRLARRIERVFEMPHGSLDIDPTLTPRKIEHSDVVDIPVLRFGDEDSGPVRSISVTKNWIANNTNATAYDYLSIAGAKGDAMHPTYREDSVLLIDRGVTKIESDAIYCFAMSGDIYVRRIQRNLDGSLTVLCDNERYKSEIVPKESRPELTVLGKVLLVWAPTKL